MPDSRRRRRAAKRQPSPNRDIKTIFVIMPFAVTPTRSEADLTEFFQTNLKSRLEREMTFNAKYIVRRSDDTFNITERIVSDLFAADLVLCDLSGHFANPNVMYELGVRLSVTNKPVILFREESGENRDIFDIQGFFVYEYSPRRYRELEDHIVAKIKKFESGAELYESPVLKVLRHQPDVVREMRRERASGIVRMLLSGLHSALMTIETAVDRFLEREVGITVGESRTAQVLVSDDPRLQAVDWSRLSFRPGVLPALQVFASEPLVTGLVDQEIEELINAFVARHYAKFFAVPSVWQAPSADLILTFLTETLMFTVVLGWLASVLSRDRAPSPALPDRGEIAKILRDGLSVPLWLSEAHRPAV